MKTCNLLVTLVTLLAPNAADADLGDRLTRYGVNVSVGGGLVQFIDTGMRDFAAEGSGWEGRIAFGTRTPLTIEAAYLGSLHEIDALGLDANASLLGTSLEANLRLNMLDGRIQPYVLTGFGWTHYHVINSGSNTSDVANSDDLAMLPMGIGVTFRQGALTVDARAVYRPTTAVDMFAGATEGSLATWSGSLRVGFEY